jgi:radical SAM protein with 4Fe4S-binding SPASM domain
MRSALTIDGSRLAKAALMEVPQVTRAIPKGCRGSACPAFTLCQGRCETRRVEARKAPDGGASTAA